jgi:uracil-DNA glycosylase family 4
MKYCGQETCPFYANGVEVADKIPLVKWNGVMVVGELPGREEVRRGVPFVGASAYMLKAVLEHLNTSIEALHVTNAIRCNFTSGAKPSDSEMEEARKCCQPILEEGILEVRPKAILTLGAVALQSVAGLKGVEKFRGATTRQVFQDLVGGEPFEVLTVSTIHPASMFRVPEKRPWFDLWVSDVEKAVRIASGRLDLWVPEVASFSFDRVQEVLGREVDVVAVDLETDGIDVRRCGITTIGLARTFFDEETGEEKFLSVSIPCPGLRARFSTKEYSKSLSLLKVALAHPKRRWVFHNMAFDVPILERCLTPIKGEIHDTLLAHHSIYPKAPHDLEAVTSQFFAVEPWKSYYDKRFKVTRDEDIPELLYYNGADTVTTVRLWDKLQTEMRRENVLTVYENDRRVTSLSMDWEKVGLGIDEDVRLELHYEYRQQIDELKEEICSMVGDSNFNPASPKQLQKVLVDHFNLIPKKVTKTGQLSTDATSLFDFQGHPFVAALQSYRTKTKLFSTYIDGLAQRVGSDKRIHPRWNKTASPSGRFGTKPAVQNWPNSMRRMLVPAPGRVIISVDFSALELRISSLLAGQEDLIEAFQNNQDIHSMFAETYFQEIWAKSSKEERKILRGHSKAVTFGDVYRAGPKTLFETVREDVPGITLQEVTIMQARKRAKYAAINAYSVYVTELANKTFELRTPWLGRRRRWPLGGVLDTEATNHPIQGGAADIVDEATLRWAELLHKKGDYHRRVWPVLQIHDDLRAEVSADYAHEALEDLKNCLRCTKKITSPITGRTYEMPFEVEGKIGRNHQDLHVV